MVSFMQSMKCLQLFQMKSVLVVISMTFNLKFYNENHCLIGSKTITTTIGYEFKMLSSLVTFTD